MTREEGLPSVPTLAARQEERAERILAAAEELLLRYGYNRVTIEDIAKRAGIGKGTIYLHWRTREALFGTLFLREVVALWRALIERVRADPAHARVMAEAGRQTARQYSWQARAERLLAFCCPERSRQSAAPVGASRMKPR